MTQKDESKLLADRRTILKSMALGSAALTGAATGLMAGIDPVTGVVGISAARADERVKMAFLQIQPHTVSAGWSKGIEEVLSTQQTVDYTQLDGQNKVEVQVSLMDTLINNDTKVIFLQPSDSVALAPSIKKAKRKGIIVITLNIDATEAHAAHVEMNHYYGAMEIAKVMGEKLGGKGDIAILNAPPGIITRDQRTNGFVDGLKKYHPEIRVVAYQVADWSRKKAQDVLSTILAANPDLAGVSAELRIQPVARVEMQKAAPVSDGKPRSGETVYNTICKACHEAGVAGAPKTGDKAAWAARIATGAEALLKSATNGKNAMPARGGAADLTDDELKAAVEYLIEKSK